MCIRDRLFVVKVNAMRVPHVGSDPTQRLHERQRTHALALQHIMLLVLRLAQVRVQPHMVLPVSYTHLDVYKRQLHVRIGFEHLVSKCFVFFAVQLARLDVHINGNFERLLYVLLRCV